MSGERALVLGGGGVAGIAWLTGVLAGLAEHGADVTDADVIIGTSAGSAVAAQLNQGLALAELLARQTDPALMNRELAVEFDFERYAEIWAELTEEHPDPAERTRALGRRALATDTVPEAERRAVVAGRLPSASWPEGDVRIVAVDALTGEHVVFERASAVPLVDAVAASCAVPLVWPPVTIGASRYVDGGARSATNADLAVGHRRVLVLAPLPLPPLEDEAELLRRDASVQVLAPDEASVAAFGVNPLDPSTRPAAAAAGLAQGRRLAGSVAALWRA
ncbi:patatin-like phospholipase family protein [Streptacidiphilus jiangxiensis]|uniref:NTE family protein n=1 Tax=Streptacidiphilus jiangxiensis TaxID=235985 RepID=A0A1H7XQ60_STRJI|nr:patatin-like phospholipase family protein [Streptacidiphilus jiangxiensis]SEM35129.1 NTE family protein [Streptacidiphilus jiangxiensis]